MPSVRSVKFLKLLISEMFAMPNNKSPNPKIRTVSFNGAEFQNKKEGTKKQKANKIESERLLLFLKNWNIPQDPIKDKIAKKSTWNE